MSMAMCNNQHEPVVYTDYDHRNRHHIKELENKEE